VCSTTAELRSYRTEGVLAGAVIGVIWVLGRMYCVAPLANNQHVVPEARVLVPKGERVETSPSTTTISVAIYFAISLCIPSSK
jgi:hypothetical protein